MLRIIASDLLLALSDHSYETTYYLDRESGAVIPVFGDMFDPGDDGYLDEEELLANPRYVPIEPVSSHDAFRWMEDFASSVTSDDLREELLGALDRRRPFRSFKDVLLAFPEERKAWFEYEEARQLEAARDYLQSEGIEAELVSHAEMALRPNGSETAAERAPPA